jgi:hypothetical protein
MGTITMPAGEYWVGDPCYAVPNDRWMEWLNAADFLRQPTPRYLLAELDGYPVLGIGTAYGDGCYPGSDGSAYPVDAGLLGVVPVEVADSDPFGMRRVVFAQPFECYYDHGTITLGHIDIDTDPEDDDWEDE